MKFYTLAISSSQFIYLSHCVDAALDSIYYSTVYGTKRSDMFIILRHTVRNTWVNSKQVGSAGERCKLPQRGPGRSPGRKRILEHFPAKKRIWSLVAAILSLNGAKNNPKIVTKITAVRPGPHKGLL